MLSHLHIENYALIRHLDISFPDGFSVITGETGAGKSIILGALGLVMGAKADVRAISEGATLCVIEAEFTQAETTYLIRRELHAAGRSRSFVNDEIVSQTELKQLAAQLIDIHSQHENLLIRDDSFQLSVVDAIARNEAERNDYHAAWVSYTEKSNELDRLQALATKSRGDKDYIQYQYDQLQEANLQAGEMQQLDNEQYRLSHADELAMQLQQAIEYIGGDQGALTMLRATSLSDDALQERLDSVEIDLKDIVREAERQLDQIESDPNRLQQVEERLGQLNTLLRKHQVRTEEELIAIRDEMEAQLNRLDNYDSDIQQLQQQQAEAFNAMSQAAERLSESRKRVRESICEHLADSLIRLGIRHAKVDIEMSELSNYTESGHDDVQLLFAANLGQTPRRVAEVASGGEISRVMLSIKSLIATTVGLPTILFDEIDTGLSGEIAYQMGSIMHQMGSTRQIIAITHLPQIAVQGDHQYRVYKADEQDHTETHIELMTDQERKSYLTDYHATISRETAS